MGTNTLTNTLPMQDNWELSLGEIPHQTQIVLYGLGNQGKTTTLTHLLFLLTNNSVKNFINTNLVPKGKNGNLHYNDAYYILAYKNFVVFIATYGDGRDECERNNNFFACKEINKDLVYVVSDNNICKLSSLSNEKQKELYHNAKPNIFITACRTDGGSVDATLYQTNKMLPHAKQIVWIRKMGLPKNAKPEYIDPAMPIVTTNDDKVANEIKQLLDRLLAGSSI